MTDFSGVEVKTATPVFIIDPATGFAASSNGVKSIPLGYERITGLSAAVGLTIPNGALLQWFRPRQRQFATGTTELIQRQLSGKCWVQMTLSCTTAICPPLNSSRNRLEPFLT